MNLLNKGTCAHARIDNHIAASSAVHGITSAVVGITDTQTLTGKTFNDTQTTCQNSSVHPKKIQFSCSGITSDQTRILSAPDYNCTLVGTINNPTLNYVVTSNGASGAWNQITTSIIL